MNLIPLCRSIARARWANTLIADHRLLVFLALFFALFFFQSVFISAQVRFVPSASWVIAHSDYKTLGESEESIGYNLLLFDRQKNVESEERYIHFVLELLTPDGIQFNSPITVDYDPTFEQVAFHHLRIIRNGLSIDRLDKAFFAEYVRENNIERHLYDGTKTVVVNIPDIRVGDVLDYAYTIKGVNPMFDGHHFGEFALGWAIPLQHQYVRLLMPNNDLPVVKVDDGLPSPVITTEGDHTVYSWTMHDITPTLVEAGIPGWFDPYGNVSYSTFKDWADLSEFMRPHYEISQNERTALESKLHSLELSGDQESQIRSVIRFVQDDVRYLGLEEGISAYRPHSPMEVLEQRFGDCKDKSLLLTQLLRAMDVRAEPLLVSSYRGKALDDHLPTPHAFDHCVMRFEENGNWVYIDPTMDYQGGDIGHIFFPSYERGLPITEEAEVVVLPVSDIGGTRIEEHLYIDSIGSRMRYTVESTFSGAPADVQRRIFSNGRMEAIQKDFLDWYRNVFPYILLKDSLTINDGVEDGQSTFTTFESYYVDSAWVGQEGGFLDMQYYSLSTEPLVNYDRETVRTMPLVVSRSNYSQSVHLHLPDTWESPDENVQISGNGYAFDHRSRYDESNQILTLDYDYSQTKQSLEADEVNAFTSDHRQMQDYLAFGVSFNTALATAGFSVWSLLGVLSLALFIAYLLVKLYRDFDPAPREKISDDLSISSWLILPFIGLVISAGTMLYTLWSEFLIFDGGQWERIFASDTVTRTIVLAEVCYNVFFLLFIGLLIILFLKRRTSLPILMVVFYLLNLLIPLLDLWATSGLLDMPVVAEDKVGIARSVLVAGLWIPVFIVSQRVTDTFVKRYRPQSEEVQWAEA